MLRVFALKFTPMRNNVRGSEANGRAYPLSSICCNASSAVPSSLNSMKDFYQNDGDSSGDSSYRFLPIDTSIRSYLYTDNLLFLFSRNPVSLLGIFWYTLFPYIHVFKKYRYKDRNNVAIKYSFFIAKIILWLKPIIILITMGE